MADAKWAGKDALDHARACGFPDDGTISIPFSFDYQVPPAQFPDARDKLAACQDGLGDAYIATSYAQSGLIRYLGRHGFGHTGHWLMASTWGLADYAVASPFVCMVQSHRADGTWLPSPIPGTDANTVTRPDKLAAWWPEGSEYGMPSVEQIAQAVWNMPLSDADGNSRPAQNWLKQARNMSDPAVLAKALAGKLTGVTEAQIEAAVRQVFADAGNP
jgi:hypothetical protein